MMKKKSKQLLAGILAVVLCAGSLPADPWILSAAKEETTVAEPDTAATEKNLFLGLSKSRIFVSSQEEQISNEIDPDDGSVTTRFSLAGVTESPWANVRYALSEERYWQACLEDATWTVYQSWAAQGIFPEYYTDLDKDDTYVYETDFSVTAGQADSYIDVQIRTADLTDAAKTGAENWYADYNGVRLSAGGISLFADMQEVGHYDTFQLAADGKEHHLTILSKPDQIWIWIDHELMVEGAAFTAPEAKVEQGRLNSTDMLPAMAVHAKGADAVFADQKLYLYDKEQQLLDTYGAAERNYYDADQAVLSNDKVVKTGKNSLWAELDKLEYASVSQELSDELKKEDTVITELTYTPYGIKGNGSWDSTIGEDKIAIAFRSDKTNPKGTLRLVIRVLADQVMFHFVDGHHTLTSGVHGTTKLIKDGQAVKVKLVHDAEKVSLYINGFAVCENFAYSSIENAVDNTVDLTKMEPVFALDFGVCNWKVEDINIRKADKSGTLANVTAATVENNLLLTEQAAITGTISEDGLTVDQNHFYTNLTWKNLSENGSTAFWSDISYAPFGANNQNLTFERSDSIVISSLVKVFNTRALSDGTNTYNHRIGATLPTYDKEMPWYFISGELLSVYHKKDGRDTFVANVDLADQIGYQAGDYLRLTNVVTPFGYEIYMNGCKVFAEELGYPDQVDYKTLAYLASGVEAQFLDAAVYYNTDNAELYREKISPYVRPYLYGQKGVWHTQKKEYDALVSVAQKACADAGSDNSEIKKYTDIKSWYETIAKEGEAVNNLVLQGEASKEVSADAQPEEGKWKYAGVSLTENGVSMQRGETWYFEADLSCTALSSGQKRIGFGLNGYQGDDYSDVALIDQTGYYWSQDGEQRSWHATGVNCSDGASIAENTNWRISYIVKPMESISTVITRISDNKEIFSDTVAWDQMGGLAEVTEDTLFRPYLMVTNVAVSLTNIYIGCDPQTAVDELKNQIEAAEAVKLQTGYYTQDSQDTFLESLEQAKALFEQCADAAYCPVSQDEIRRMTAKLAAAKETLVKNTTSLTVGGETSHTTPVTVTAVAGETLPGGKVEDKYIYGWKVGKKKQAAYDPSIDASDYEAQFVDEKMLDIKYQTTEEVDGKRSVRFIASVDSVNYQKAGFLFSIYADNEEELVLNGTSGKKILNKEHTYVYETLIADGNSVDVNGAGYDAYSVYLLAHAWTDVPVGTTIYARAYVITATGEIVYGNIRAVAPESQSDITAAQSKAVTDAYHDQGGTYMTPDEPQNGDDLTLQLRTEHNNVTGATLQYTTGDSEGKELAKLAYTSTTNSASLSWTAAVLSKTLISGSFPYETGETWVIETDVTTQSVTKTSEGVRVGLNLFGESIATVMIQQNAFYVWNPDGKDWTHCPGTIRNGINLNTIGETWHFKYIVYANQTIQTIVTDQSGTVVADYTADITAVVAKHGSMITPKFMTRNGKVKFENIKMYSFWDEVKMERAGGVGSELHDYWKAEIPVSGEKMYYRFRIENNAGTVYYDQNGISSTSGSYTKGWNFIVGHQTPDWAKGALVYSLMPDSFYNGNTTNDKQTSGNSDYAAWNQLRNQLNNRYGGDLDGVEAKLDYLQSLYVDAVYMNPISKSYQVAGYGTVRYDEIESAFGNEQDLVTLADATHERGMKLIGDVVLYFTDKSSYYFNQAGYWPVDGATQSENSAWESMYWKASDDDTDIVSTIWNKYASRWSGVELNLGDSVAKDLIYATAGSYLPYYAQWFDGYRFDCGGSYRAQDEDGNTINRAEIIRAIADSVKGIKEDFLVMSEADGSNMKNGTWDSQWNLGYNAVLSAYANGTKDETDLEKAMASYIDAYPRNVALCLQNMLGDHDRERIAQDDDYMYQAALLVQMTYPGSPTIYYGDETKNLQARTEGIGSDQSFYAMDWDESNWDQDRLNLYRATGELRQKYSCLKTGTVKKFVTDSTNNLMIFGRFDSTGAAVTVASQNADTITVTLPVHELDVKNGTVMTDWYTGKQYTVCDGEITAEIQAGGTVFVTGKTGSSYLMGYDSTIVGAYTDGSAILAENTQTAPAAEKLQLDGTGVIGQKSDRLTFTHRTAYQDFMVEAALDGTGAFLIRDGLDADAAYYGVTVAGGKLAVTARSADGMQAKVLASGITCGTKDIIRLVRTADNTFSAYINGSLIGNSVFSIGMNRTVYYGFTPLGGTLSVGAVTVTKTGCETLFDDFDGIVPKALFDNLDADGVTFKNGKLILAGTGASDEQMVLTNAKEDDWTFKADISYTPSKGAYAGIVSRQDENNYVIAGRTVRDGKKVLFLGKYANGSLADYASVEVEEDQVLIQLQRVGAYYAAVYSLNDGATWNEIGRLYTNYSAEQVGILIRGKGNAVCDWASFGDAIHDAGSYNTPYTLSEVTTDYRNATANKEAVYEKVSGDWEMVTAGWKQSSTGTDGRLAVTSGTYTDLYAEATMRITDGKGSAGFSFGQSAADKAEGSSFDLAYDADGNLTLRQGDKTLKSVKATAQKDGSLRLVLHAYADGQIVVYAGQDATCVLQASDTGYTGGYTSFFTKSAAAEFCNFYHGAMHANWSCVSGTMSGRDTVLYVSSYAAVRHGAATLAGYGFTDFVSSVVLNAAKTGDETCKAGLLLGTSTGAEQCESGVYIYRTDADQLCLSVNGEVKQSYTMTESICRIMVVKQNKTYRVYLNGSAEPVMSYEDAIRSGGVVTAYVMNGTGTFANLTIDPLKEGEDYKNTQTGVLWQMLANETDENFTDDFEKTASIGAYAVYNKEVADYTVEDGVLKCKNTSGLYHGNSLTVLSGTYEDVEMEFDLRLDSASGWIGILTRQDDLTLNHVNSGCNVLLQPGRVLWHPGDGSNSVKQTDEAAGFFAKGTWYRVKVVTEGNTMTVYASTNLNPTWSDADKIAAYTDTAQEAKAGYIGFMSGNENFSIDNLKITKK